MNDNLNSYEVENQTTFPYKRVSQLSAGNTTVFFDGIEKALCDTIDQYPAIVGCIAWLTNRRILQALARRQVSLVVQKEDFLRPDWNSNRYNVELRQLYGNLENRWSRYEFSGLIARLNQAGGDEILPIQCCGNHNRDKKPAFPRMHHKFVVFCDITTNTYEEGDESYTLRSPTPRAVWTGSFNFTENAASSFENALLIKDEQVATAYFNEWQHIYALSEPLDWRTDWVTADHRIGT